MGLLRWQPSLNAPRPLPRVTSAASRQTLWYRIVQIHLETWLELASGADGESPPPQAGVHKGAPGARPAALVLTPLALITKIAALVPPPRAHRHRD